MSSMGSRMRHLGRNIDPPGTASSTSEEKGEMREMTVAMDRRGQQNTLVGTCALLSFVVIWFSSLLSPVLITAALTTRRWRLAAALLALAALGYAPGIPYVDGLRDWFQRASSLYWERCSLVYEPGSIGGGKKKEKTTTTKTTTAAAATTEQQGAASKEAQPTILCVAPHGILCMGWSTLFTRPELRHVHFCFSKALYLSPYFRLLCRLIGRPASADKASMTKLMRRGHDLALIPGGFEEASIHSMGQDRVYLKHRMGFVKYALQFGYSLTPVFAFGERFTMYNLQGGWSLRTWLNGFGIPAVVPFGRWWCPLLPQPTPLQVVVGSPITPSWGAEPIDKPSPEQVAKFHKEYIDALKQLYVRHKQIFPGSAQQKELAIW